MDEAYYKRNLDILAELQNEITKSKVEWYKNIVFLSSTIFGIQIAFYGKSSIESKYLHVIAIGLLALSIISGLIALYQIAYYQKKSGKIFRNNMSKAMKNNERIEPAISKKLFVFQFAGFLCVLSFCLSVVSFFFIIAIDAGVF